MRVVLLAVVLAVLVYCCAAAPRWNELEEYSFDDYVSDFDKGYIKGTAEYAKREAIFTEALLSIKAWNRNPLHLYRQGVNHITDTTSEERKKSLFGYKPSTRLGTPTYNSQRPYVMTGASIPDEIDYRYTQPAVLSAVKNQGECGSCWAFASTAEVESMHAVATGRLFVLSPQQLASCVQNPQQCGGTGGCSGATPELAFDYLVNVSGMTEEWTYPYSSFYGDSGVCAFNRSLMKAPVNLTAFYKLPENLDAPLAEALALRGPIAVSVDASNWYKYESGIFDGCNSSANITIDHAVQLVGYGSEAGQRYWIIRNSWSARFGENGYIRLLRDPACGWSTPNSEGDGCAGDPDAVWTCGMCGILYDNTFPLVGAAPGPRPVFLASVQNQGTTYTKGEFTVVSAAAGVLAVISALSVIALLRRPRASSYNALDQNLHSAE